MMFNMTPEHWCTLQATNDSVVSLSGFSTDPAPYKDAAFKKNVAQGKLMGSTAALQFLLLREQGWPVDDVEFIVIRKWLEKKRVDTKDVIVDFTEHLVLQVPLNVNGEIINYIMMPTLMAIIRADDLLTGGKWYLP